MVVCSKPAKRARLVTMVRTATVLICSQCLGGTDAKRTERMSPSPRPSPTMTTRMAAPSVARQVTKVMVEMPSSAARRDSTPSVP